MLKEKEVKVNFNVIPTQTHGMNKKKHLTLILDADDMREKNAP